MKRYKNWSEAPLKLASKTKLRKESLKPFEASVTKVYQRANNKLYRAI